MQPKSQFSSDESAHKASATRFSRTQLLRKSHVTTNPRQLRQSNPRGAVKKKGNGIKNEGFIGSNVAHISGSKPDMKRKQVKIHEGVQMLEGEEGEQVSTGVFGSPE